LRPVSCLADVEDLAIIGEHAVDTRTGREVLEKTLVIESAGFAHDPRIARISPKTASNIAGVRRLVWVLYLLQW
jgi:hypothetical protein